MTAKEALVETLPEAAPFSRRAPTNTTTIAANTAATTMNAGNIRARSGRGALPGRDDRPRTTRARTLAARSPSGDVQGREPPSARSSLSTRKFSRQWTQDTKFGGKVSLATMENVARSA